MQPGSDRHIRAGTRVGTLCVCCPPFYAESEPQRGDWVMFAERSPSHVPVKSRRRVVSHGAGVRVCVCVCVCDQPRLASGPRQRRIQMELGPTESNTIEFCDRNGCGTCFWRFLTKPRSPADQSGHVHACLLMRCDDEANGESSPSASTWAGGRIVASGSVYVCVE